jgi:hypothetical protein
MAQEAVSSNDPIVTSHHRSVSREFRGHARLFRHGAEFHAGRRDEPPHRHAPVSALPEACVPWAMLERSGYRIELFKYYGLRGERHDRLQLLHSK